MTSQVFYVQYQVRPLKQNELWGEAGGAYVHCYYLSSEAEKAASAARAALCESHWEIVSVEKGPWPLNREDLADPEEQEHFDIAASEGECLVYFLWPAEPQEDDAIH